MKHNEETFIKHNLYTPKNWIDKSSTESFTNDLLPLIKSHLIYDIVSTSDESQSSSKMDGKEVTKPSEDNEI